MAKNAVLTTSSSRYEKRLEIKSGIHLIFAQSNPSFVNRCRPRCRLTSSREFYVNDRLFKAKLAFPPQTSFPMGHFLKSAKTNVLAPSQLTTTPLPGVFYTSDLFHTDLHPEPLWSRVLVIRINYVYIDIYYCIINVNTVRGEEEPNDSLTRICCCQGVSN